MEAHAAVVWTGDLKKGHGAISTESTALRNAPYSFTTRFGEEKGTNPEELIAAAHAACFSMALAAKFTENSQTPRSINTSATVTLDKQGADWTIVSSHLDAEVDMDGMEEGDFEKLAEDVKNKCPVSRVLNATLTLNARLKGQRQRVDISKLTQAP